MNITPCIIYKLPLSSCQIDDKYTKEKPPVVESIWSDDAEGVGEDSSHQSMPKFLYTNSRTISLPVTRRMAQRGLITLR